MSIAYLPTRGRKLTPVIEYLNELDDSDESVYESSIDSPAASRIEFEIDKQNTTGILKGLGIGVLFGIGLGIWVGKKLFS